MALNGLTTLDMAGEDEATVRLRLDQEIPALINAGAGSVVLQLGERDALRRPTVEAIALAHRELRAVGGRLVVVGSRGAALPFSRSCPDLLVAATVRQAHAALGMPSA